MDIFLDNINRLCLNKSTLNDLDRHFAANSYCKGYSPSQIDTALLMRIQSSILSINSYPHLKRWYTHILSYNQQLKHPCFSQVSFLIACRIMDYLYYGICHLANSIEQWSLNWGLQKVRKRD